MWTVCRVLYFTEEQADFVFILFFCHFQIVKGETELSLEGAEGIGSELSRVHIVQKNKQMADMLKVKKKYTHIKTLTY